MNTILIVLLSIMIIFTVYNFWSDIRNSLNTGKPIIEGMDDTNKDSSLDDTGRCGPLFNEKKCTSGNYCNESNGWCGVTDAHKNSRKYKI